ncbi:MAG: hypothetical protein H3C26_16135 [Rhodocyclaceae bacterium]|nr:hypothetical protein [Rhodocyclaceae bacterium]
MIVLTEAELDLLSGEPAEVLKLYVCLRRRMDFATGLVGAMTGVSWWALREDMHVSGAQGRARGESGTPSERMVERKVDRLVALGLVERRSLYRKLVFLLPMAHRASARPKEVGPSWGREAGPEVGPEVGPTESQTAQWFAEEVGPKVGPEVGPSWGREVGPTSGIRVNHLSKSKPAAALPAVVDAREALLLAPQQMAEWLREAERRRGKILRVVPTDPLLKTWSSERVQLDDLRAAHAMAVADRDARGEPAPVSPGFLRIFLDRLRRRNGGVENDVPWFRSAAGIEAQGAALGVFRQPGERFPSFRARVYAAAGITDDVARRL